MQLVVGEKKEMSINDIDPLRLAVTQGGSKGITNLVFCDLGIH